MLTGYSPYTEHPDGDVSVLTGLTTSDTLGILLWLATRRVTCGDVAQLGERCLRTAEVGGSNPLVSTNDSDVEAVRDYAGRLDC